MFSIGVYTSAIVFVPLLAGLIAGIFGNQIGRVGAHSVTIIAISISFVLSLIVCHAIFINQQAIYNSNFYTWGISGNFTFNLGFLIDNLSAAMMAIVTFISLAVHIYSIGYMHDDAGYQRFFSYISLFTFAMLMLVTANNFLQLYFGWEGVGLISYLLIGFWFKKDSANFGSMKAFIVNRVGDFGFLLGIAAILSYTNTLDFSHIFAQAPQLAMQTLTILPHSPWSVMTVICLLLFIGAMGKSAQMPLHVWLPESMEGPTPISALIHAATMVTAGIYLVSRLSPLYEYSPTALSVVLIVGATGALFTGILALVMNDIKRVVAYSTLSQLGYMIAALGASAYAAGIFHLLTHAFFKALLFLAAGSVILALHHEQDMRCMGGLWKKMPITYISFLIGALALSAVPPFAGFYSKDLIIDAIHLAKIPGAHYAYFCVLLGAFITPLYIFRAFFMTFHGASRSPTPLQAQLHESPWVITFPLVILAIPSIISGIFLTDPLIFNHAFSASLFVLPHHNVLATLPFSNAAAMLHDAFVSSLSLYFALAGLVVAWLFYQLFPALPSIFANHFQVLYQILYHKYGFDDFNERVLVRGTRYLANLFFNVGDIKIVDDTFVNGSGRIITRLSHISRKMQSGYLYHYALIMVLGLLAFLCWLLLG
jgi:NADH-quinone oxidoreductase subunit L